MSPTIARAPSPIPIVLSAYNAAPAGLTDRPRDETAWYATLRADAALGGLEIPVVGSSVHPRGVAHLASLLHPEWGNVLSAMSGTLFRLWSDENYGLASQSVAGRNAALTDAEGIRRTVAEMRGLLGAQSVQAVVLHSAPRADRGSAAKLEDSLLQIASHDWGRMIFLLEHADALVTGRKPQKGWQPLSTEIDVVRKVRARTGLDFRLLLNWGRLAIEARSAAGARRLFAQAVASDLVGAVTFSGATGSPHSRGHSWADVHLGLDIDESSSLLTTEIVQQTLGAAPDDLAFVGVKSGAPAWTGNSLEGRLGLARTLIDCVVEHAESRVRDSTHNVLGGMESSHDRDG